MKSIFYNSIYVVIVFCLSGCHQNMKTFDFSQKLDLTKNYKVIILAGQSNMIGLGNPKEIAPFIFPSNISYFNVSLDTNLNSYTGNFGQEVGIAQSLTKNFPNENFILIKYAVGGFSLIDWSPHQNQYSSKTYKYSHLYENMISLTQDITKKYKTSIEAFIWMQGEADANKITLAEDYASNFTQLIISLRKDFDDEQLPIIYGRINTSYKNQNATQIVRSTQDNLSRSSQYILY